MKRNLFIIILVTLLMLVFVFKFDRNKSVVSSNYLGVIKNAPSMQDLTNSRQVNLSEYAGKYVIVLEVWETWCPACKKSIPELIKLYDSFKKFEKIKNNVVFFSFVSNSSGSNSDIVNFIKQNGINYPVLMDNSYYISKNFGVRYIPSLFIIDKEGNLRYSKVGPESSSILEAELFKILK